jgi:hypothetical protein
MPTLPKHQKALLSPKKGARSTQDGNKDIEALAVKRLQSFDRKKAIPHAEMAQRFAK